MADLVVLVMVEIGSVETAIAGKIIALKELKPEDGNHPKFSENTSISIRPSQNEGIDAPTREHNVAM